MVGVVPWRGFPTRRLGLRVTSRLISLESDYSSVEFRGGGADLASPLAPSAHEGKLVPAYLRQSSIVSILLHISSTLLISGVPGGFWNQLS